MATTHHDRLKAYASTTPGIVNAAMEFDETNLAAHLSAAGGRSGNFERHRNRAAAGLAGARDRACASQPVARIARGPRTDRVSASQPRRGRCARGARLAKSLPSSKQSAGRCKRNGSTGRRSESPSWKRHFLELQKRFESEVARLASDIKDRATRAQIEKQTGRRMGQIVAEARGEADAAVVETLAASQQDLGVSPEAPAKPVEPEQLVAGARVSVKGFKQPVIFRRQDGRTAEVEAGVLRMKVPLADILRIEESAERERRFLCVSSAAARAASRFTRAPATRPAGQEINVIGCTVDEATRRVDKFLDEAALAGAIERADHSWLWHGRAAAGAGRVPGGASAGGSGSCRRQKIAAGMPSRWRS